MDGQEDLPTKSASAESAPERRTIGDFRIIRELGRGGMGVVYEAEQQHPQRPVALKVIRGGRYVDEMAVKMFEREAQALARLKHPGIAAIYESGRTDEGEHYFAMELVRGESLTEWLRGRESDAPLTRDEIRVRFGLFRRVCEAVAYAHQRGVVHRDIKPTNILVLREAVSEDASLSGVPDVKILDFGLARITDTDLAASSVLTQAGVVQGTLRYMSPEQIRANPDEMDLRTDVYSLGVVLYEMLTGRLPFDFEGCSMVEAARRICDDLPAHLSKNWRGTKRPDRDLETIVGKALAKAPADRYQSVTAMSEDLKRYLSTLPILARHPSTLYQLRKMIGRHKIGFAFAASVVALLAVLAVTMTIQTGRIARERDRANQEAATAEQVSEFLVDLFEVSDPSEARGNTITAREILDQGAHRIGQELEDQPRVQGRLMSTMGRVYRNLGLYDEARPLAAQATEILQRELGGEHPEALRSRQNLALLLWKTGDYESAMESFERALETRESQLGPEHPELATLLNDMAALLLETGAYEEARKLYERSLAIREKGLGPAHPDVASSLTNLAMVLRRLGRYQEALPLAERALSIQERNLGRNHPDLAAGLIGLGNLHFRMGAYEAARPLYERALKIRETALGSDHPEVASALNNLGSVHWALHDYDAARPLYERALAIREARLGPRHTRTATSLNNLAELLKATGDYDRARPLYERALAVRESVFGPDHPRVASTLSSLAELLVETGAYDEARKHYERALDILERALDPEHPQVASTLTGLGDLYVATGDYPRAWSYYERAVEIRRKKLPPDHPETGDGLYRMARLAAIESDRERALELLREALNHGYGERDLLEEDAFDILRGSEEFESLVAELETRLEGK